MKLVRSGLLRGAVAGLLWAWVLVFLVAPASADTTYYGPVLVSFAESPRGTISEVVASGATGARVTITETALTGGSSTSYRSYYEWLDSGGAVTASGNCYISPVAYGTDSIYTCTKPSDGVTGRLTLYSNTAGSTGQARVQLEWVGVTAPTPTATPAATATPEPTVAPTATPRPTQGPLGCVDPGTAPSSSDDAYTTARNTFGMCIAMGTAVALQDQAVGQADVQATQVAVLVKGSDDQVLLGRQTSYAAALGTWFLPVLLVAVVGGFVLRGPK